MEQSLITYEIPGLPRDVGDMLDNAAPSPTKHFTPDPINDDGTNEFAPVRSASECSEEKQSFTAASRPDDQIIQIVREYMEEHGLEVRFDGGFVQNNALQMAHSAADIDRVLAQEEKDEEALVDEVVMLLHSRGDKVAVGLVHRAVRMILRRDQQTRLAAVMRPMLLPMPSEKRFEAEEQWKQLVGTVFDMDTDLGVAILKKFVYSVKSKQAKRPVYRHLMPIFQSMIQGGGKTTAAIRLLGPLKELRTEPALLSDFADKRSGDIYRYPVVFIDDMDRISPAHIPTLNSLVTGEGLQRRRLGSSGSRKTRQRSTLIGTCNRPVSDIIPDETGNRRLANMPFRNGEILKGGDTKVWEVINETDFDLLWRSVDVFGEDPIEPFLDQLFQWQQSYRRLDHFEEWLVNLDLDSNEVRAISDKKGVRAAKLHELFLEQTKSTMTATKFGNEMRRFIELSRGPFGQKDRDDQGHFYPCRAQC